MKKHQTQKYDIIQKLKFEETDDLKIAGEFSLVAFLLVGIATNGMLGIYLILKESEPIWAGYALMMFIFGLIGVIAINYYHNKRFAILSNYYRKNNSDHVFYAFLVYGILLLIQVITGTLEAYLSPAKIIEIAYTVFASVNEELFYRGAILGFFVFWANGFGKNIINKQSNIITTLGIIVSSAAFAASHTNYYNHPLLLVSVFLSGVTLGSVYVWKKDILIPMLAHFLLNCTVVGPDFIENILSGGLF